MAPSLIDFQLRNTNRNQCEHLYLAGNIPAISTMAVFNFEHLSPRRSDTGPIKQMFHAMEFDMGSVQELRAKAQKLYEEAAKITIGDQRLVVILRAVELEAKADMLEDSTEPFFPYSIRSNRSDGGSRDNA